LPVLPLKSFPHFVLNHILNSYNYPQIATIAANFYFCRYIRMKNNKIIVFLSILLVISVVINSCKKDNPQTSIASLFTNGKWELASVERQDLLGSSYLLDTIYTACDTTQFFNFPTNSSCTFSNYHCIDQQSTGTWSLTSNGLYLQSNIALKDTLTGDSCCVIKHPFEYAQIVNVGLYSLALRTGDIGAYFTATQKRTIYIYSFVRISTTN